MYIPRKRVLTSLQRSILQSAAREPLPLNKTLFGPFNCGAIIRLVDRGYLSLVPEGKAVGITDKGLERINT